MLALFGVLAYFIGNGFSDAGFVTFGNFRGGSAEKIGYALFTDYLLPFEVVSVHLLVVLIGAAYLARAKKRARPRNIAAVDI